MKSIRLQGKGLATSQDAEKIKVGDIVFFNYGEKYKVESLRRTPKTVVVVFNTSLGPWVKRFRNKQQVVINKLIYA